MRERESKKHERRSRKRVCEEQRETQREQCLALRPLRCVAFSAMNILSRISPAYGTLDFINAI